MKNCGHNNVMKHRQINKGDKYITLAISLKFGSMENMKITSSDPKYYWVISGKGSINSMDLKTIVRPKKKKSMYDIINIIMKDV